MKPSVGRVVHYVSHGTPVQSDGSQVYESECRAAMVVGLDRTPEENQPGEVWADLCVLNPTGLFFNQTVRQDEEDKRGGTWHWPERVEEASG